MQCQINRPSENPGFRIVRVPGNVVVQLLTEGADLSAVVAEGLPPGAKLVDCYFEGGRLVIVFSHDSWPEVLAGQPDVQLQLSIASKAAPLTVEITDGELRAAEEGVMVTLKEPKQPPFNFAAALASSLPPGETRSVAEYEDILRKIDHYLAPRVYCVPGWGCFRPVYSEPR